MQDSQKPTPASFGDAERHWLEHVYRRGEKQLTARAVVSGMLIGMVMCLSNLYVVLKTGWSMGVTITACILAWALFQILRTARIARSEFTILENNAMSSVASAAGYMTGGGNMAAIPALLMLTGALPDWKMLVLWVAVIAALGVFAAVPIKRQLINKEELAFPTGTATAETLRALHQHGGEGANKARRLFVSSIVGAIIAWFRDVKTAWMPFNLPGHVGLPFSIAGRPAVEWTVGVEGSLLLFGGGALMSFKTGWSMALAGGLAYGVIAPILHAAGIVQTISYKGIVQWLLWPGAAVLVSSGLLSFAFQWRMIGASFRGITGFLSRSAGKSDDPLAEVECPPHWFPVGFLVLGPAVVFLMIHLFGVPWWAAILSLPMAVVMGMVAARVTGETDVTPTKALGPVTQLVYGGMVPGNIPVNVMSANVTGGIGLHAADLLTDLKSGYLLGANPRQQLQAQLFGVVAGALVVIPVFNLLVPSADSLGTDTFPAPSVQVWAGVSKVLATGAEALHPSARWAVLGGAILGIILTLLEKFAPKKLRPFVPSASGVGVAMVIPAYNAFMFALGAAWAEWLRRRRGAGGDDVSFPIGSGFIAGESLMGVLIAMLAAFGILS